MRGRRVILVFYPADWEPVSQQQLTLYQDHLAAFARLGAVLLAISTDHVWCHGAFARAAGLAYPLLADAHPHGAVARAYGVYDEQTGLSARTLFVLDERGVIGARPLQRPSTRASTASSRRWRRWAHRRPAPTARLDPTCSQTHPAPLVPV
jgi:peroxiredoxin